VALILDTGPLYASLDRRDIDAGHLTMLAKVLTSAVIGLDDALVRHR